jgi:hypothetical protein
MKNLNEKLTEREKIDLFSQIGIFEIIPADVEHLKFDPSKGFLYYKIKPEYSELGTGAKMYDFPLFSFDTASRILIQLFYEMNIHGCKRAMHEIKGMDKETMDKALKYA